jgi:hypothetical protein
MAQYPIKQQRARSNKQSPRSFSFFTLHVSAWQQYPTTHAFLKGTLRTFEEKQQTEAKQRKGKNLKIVTASLHASGNGPARLGLSLRSLACIPRRNDRPTQPTLPRHLRSIVSLFQACQRPTRPSASAPARSLRAYVTAARSLASLSPSPPSARKPPRPSHHRSARPAATTRNAQTEQAKPSTEPLTGKKTPQP